MSTTTQDDNSLRAMKARQTRKIQQLREVFLTDGRLSVRKQAELLGLRPSTAHAVLQRNYKNSGLSAAIINRMLACPNLPERAQTIILEYNAEKIAGLYGHTRSQRRRFMAALATEALITITVDRDPLTDIVDRDPLTEASGLRLKDASPKKQQESAT